MGLGFRVPRKASVAYGALEHWGSVASGVFEVFFLSAVFLRV